MEIYDGRYDKKSYPTKHTVAVVSTNQIKCGCKDQMTIRNKGRSDWSLFYCESGCMYFENIAVDAGHMWIYPPLIPQRYMIYGKDNTIYRYLHFTGSDVADMLNSLHIDFQVPVAVTNGSIVTAFESIQMSMNDDSALSALKAEYHTLYLISLIAKHQKRTIESSMMKRVTDTMEHSFAAKYDAATYARMLNISISRFNHLFKECIGQSPYAYYLNLRIENAVSLLDGTEMKIHDISRQCGFEDPLYFTQVFKRIRGLTPSAHRKSSKKI